MACHRLGNSQNEYFTIEQPENAGDSKVTSKELARVLSDNIKNLAEGTLQTSDPLVNGQLWNNGGVVTVSAG